MLKWHKKAYHHGNEKDIEVASYKDSKQNVLVPVQVQPESSRDAD